MSQPETNLPLVEAVQPYAITDEVGDVFVVGLPPKWKAETLDHEPFHAHPRRPRTTDTHTTVESFIAAVTTHAKPESTSIYAQLEPENGKLRLLAMFDDHHSTINDRGEDIPGWRQHRAVFDPAKSTEWNDWTARDKTEMSQANFADFLEDHIDDIAAADGFPTGADMLAFATALEINSDKKLKSVVNTQTGGRALVFIDQADQETSAKLETFKKFRIGIQVFRGGPAYPLEARLKLRPNSGNPMFWYELIRPDAVFETAATAVIAVIDDNVAPTIYYGVAGDQN